MNNIPLVQNTLSGKKMSGFHLFIITTSILFITFLNNNHQCYFVSDSSYRINKAEKRPETTRDDLMTVLINNHMVLVRTLAWISQVADNISNEIAFSFGYLFIPKTKLFRFDEEQRVNQLSLTNKTPSHNRIVIR